MSTREASNAPTFEPLALADAAFMAWAMRVGLRLANKPPGSPAGAIERAILMEGTPSPEWAQRLVVMMRLAQSNKREALARSDQGKKAGPGSGDTLPNP